jgi:AraC-like DNA-binding protein
MDENIYYDPAVRLLFCGWQRQLPQWNYDNLSAPFWRLYWNRNAGATISFGRKWKLGPSKFFLIPPNTPFASRLVNPVGHLYLHFVARPPFDTVAPAIFTFDVPNDLRPAKRELIELLEANAGPTMRVAMLSRALIFFALAQLPQEKLTVPRTDPRISAAIEWIDAHPEKSGSNEQLARGAHMAVNSFIRLFRNTAGLSPQAFSRARRIDKACLLLNFSDAGIKEIADATGFCDRYHFSRAFKEQRGIGPAEYRRRMQAVTGPATLATPPL